MDRYESFMASRWSNVVSVRTFCVALLLRLIVFILVYSSAGLLITVNYNMSKINTEISLELHLLVMSTFCYFPPS